MNNTDTRLICATVSFGIGAVVEIYTEKNKRNLGLYDSTGLGWGTLMAYLILFS